MYHINLEKKRLTRLDDLETVSLNDTAAILMNEVVLNKRSFASVASDFAICEDQVRTDFQDFMNFLKEKGFDIIAGDLMNMYDPSLNYYLNQNSKYVSSDALCAFPISSMVLDYNGDLRNCFYSDSFGNINDYKAIDWSAKYSLANLAKGSACKGCRGKVFCG